MKRALAAAHLLLISPAVLFLVAVLVQRLQLLRNEPAHTAQHIVLWYAERMWTLWILLPAFPLSVLISGWLSLLRDSSAGGQIASLPQKALAGLHPAGAAGTSVAVTTVTAAVIVGVVILHMLAN